MECSHQACMAQYKDMVIREMNTDDTDTFA
jgi:hypothetical protein